MREINAAYPKATFEPPSLPFILTYIAALASFRALIMADLKSTTKVDSKSSESPFPGPPPEKPSRNHFVFVLIPGQFDLNIPTGKRWCRKPFKYLRFLAWAILHLDGKIVLKDGTEVNENGWQDFTPHEIYYFLPNEPCKSFFIGKFSRWFRITLPK